MPGDKRNSASSPIVVRPVSDADLPALTRLDLTYPAARYLAIDRTGTAPHHSFAFTWHNRQAPDAVYAEYSLERLQRATKKADLFLVADIDGSPAGLLMILVPSWTDAAEITDLAVERSARRSGAGRALVNAASVWAREHGHRALWVEPRSDNAEAIEFYLHMGFRISGFNDRMYSNTDDEAGATTLFMHLELPER